MVMATAADESTYVVAARGLYYALPLGKYSYVLWLSLPVAVLWFVYALSGFGQGYGGDPVLWAELVVSAVIVIAGLIINVWWGCGYVRRRRLIVEPGQATLVYADGHTKTIRVQEVTYCTATGGTSTFMWFRKDLTFWRPVTGEYHLPLRLPGTGMRPRDIVEAARRFNELNDLHVEPVHSVGELVQAARSGRAQFLTMRAERKAERTAVRRAARRPQLS